MTRRGSTALHDTARARILSAVDIVHDDGHLAIDVLCARVEHLESQRRRPEHTGDKQHPERGLQPRAPVCREAQADPGLVGEGVQAGRGTTVLIATHNNAVAAHADRILRLRDGQLVS